MKLLFGEEFTSSSEIFAKTPKTYLTNFSWENKICIKEIKS